MSLEKKIISTMREVAGCASLVLLAIGISHFSKECGKAYTDQKSLNEYVTEALGIETKIKHHKYKPYIERESLTARLFYKINFELNLEKNN